MVFFIKNNIFNLMNNDIIIFHHSYLVNNWLDILSEQLEILKESELYKNSKHLHFCCFSELEQNIFDFIKIIKEFDSDNKCTIIIQPYNDNERLTLTYMQTICKNLSDEKVLYFHTKGVTSHLRYGENGDKNIRSWRKIMEYYLIENWRNCHLLVDDHDVVGVFYGSWYLTTGQVVNYFSGNFWWSKVSHINKTPDMKGRDSWLGCESLITSIPHIWFNFRFAPPNLSMYDIYFDPDEYRSN